MLRTEEIWQRYQKICIVHGARHSSDLAYTDEINSYRQQYPGRICLIQALTREEHPDALQGRIPALLEAGRLEEVAGFPLQADNSTLMLCGNPAMLDDMEEKLGQRGMTRHRSKSPGQIVLERYW